MPEEDPKNPPENRIEESDLEDILSTGRNDDEEDILSTGRNDDEEDIDDITRALARQAKILQGFGGTRVILPSRERSSGLSSSQRRTEAREARDGILAERRLDSALPEYPREMLGDAPCLRVEKESSHLFCDQTNFTGVSELITKLEGSKAGEKINELINEAIVESLRIVNNLGGDTVLFGGDAIQVMFTGEGHEEKAALASVLIQDHLQNKLKEYLTKSIEEGRNIHHYLVPPAQEEEKEIDKKERESKRDILTTIDENMRSSVSKIENIHLLKREGSPPLEEEIQVADKIKGGNYTINVKTYFSPTGKEFYREYTLPLTDHARPKSPKFNVTKIVVKYDYDLDQETPATNPKDIAFKIKRKASIGVHSGTAFLSVNPSSARDEKGDPARYNFQVTGPGPNKMAAVETHAQGETSFISEETYQRLVNLGCGSYLEFFERPREENGGMTMDYEMRVKKGCQEELSRKYDTFHHLATKERKTYEDHIEEKFAKCFEPTILERIQENREPILDRFFTTFIKIPQINDLETKVAEDTASEQELLNAYEEVFNIMYNVVRGYGGIINKFNGSAGLIIFWPPEADDADRAINCANEIYEKLFQAGYISYLGTEQGENLLGAAGQVTPNKCEDNKSRRMEETCIGNAVNTAARYADEGKKIDKKKEEEDRIGGCFYGPTVDQMSSMEGGTPKKVRLKGKAGEIPIRRATGKKKEREHKGELVNHQAFLKQVDTLLSSDEDRRLLAQGTEGSGKSRLVFECEREIQERNKQGENIAYRRIACHQGEQETAFSPWLTLLKNLFKKELDSSRENEEGNVVYAVAEFEKILKPYGLNDLAPLICEYLLPPEKKTNLQILKIEASEEKRFLRDIIITLLGKKCNEQRFVVALEDIHYADEFSLKLIRKLEKYKFNNSLSLVFTSLTGGHTPFGKPENKAAERMVKFLETGEDDSKETPAGDSGSAYRKIPTENYKLSGLSETEIETLLLRQVRFQSETQFDTKDEVVEEPAGSEILSRGVTTRAIELFPEEKRGELIVAAQSKGYQSDQMPRALIKEHANAIKELSLKSKIITLVDTEHTEFTLLARAITAKINDNPIKSIKGNPIKAERLLYEVLSQSKFIETKFDDCGTFYVLSDATLQHDQLSWETHISEWLDETKEFKKRLAKLPPRQRNIVNLSLLMPEGFTVNDLATIAELSDDNFAGTDGHPLPDMNKEDIEIALNTLSQKSSNFLQAAGSRGSERVYRISDAFGAKKEIMSLDKTRRLEFGSSHGHSQKPSSTIESTRSDVKTMARHGDSLMAAHKENRHLAAAYTQEKRLDKINFLKTFSQLLEKILQESKESIEARVQVQQEKLIKLRTAIEEFIAKHGTIENENLETVLERISEILTKGSDLESTVNSTKAEIDLQIDEYREEEKMLTESLARHYHEAAKNLKKLKSDPDTGEDRVAWIEGIEGKAKKFCFEAGNLRIGHPTAAAYFKNALSYVTEKDEERYRLKFEIAKSTYKGGQAKLAREKFIDLLQEAKEQNDTARQSLSLNAIAQVTSDWAEKIPYIQESLALAIESKSGPMIFTVLRNFIASCGMLGSYKLGRNLFNSFSILYESLAENKIEDEEEEISARKLFTESLPQEEISKIGAVVHQCLSNAKTFSKDAEQNTSPLVGKFIANSPYDLGKTIIESTLGISKENQEKRFKETHELNIRLKIEQGDWSDILGPDREKTEYFEKHAGSREHHYIGFVMAEYFQDHSQHSEALEHAQEKLAAQEKLGDFTQIVSAKAALARSLIYCDRIDEAIDLLQQNHILLKRTKLYKDNLKKISIELAHAFFEKNDFENAKRFISEFDISDYDFHGKCVYGMILAFTGQPNKAKEIYDSVINDVFDEAVKENLEIAKTFIMIYLTKLRRALNENGTRTK